MTNRRNDPTKLLRDWLKGNPLTAKHLQEPVEALNRMVQGVEAPRQIESLIEENVRVRQFRIKQIFGDYLRCKTWNGVKEGDGFFNVAKGYELRRTPFDGKTVAGVAYVYQSDQERTADGVTETVTQAYDVNDVIYAAIGIDGGTGVKVNDILLKWIDINTDGRQFQSTGTGGDWLKWDI